MQIVIIGIGGGGSYLLPPLLKTLSHNNLMPESLSEDLVVTLVDGDKYESKNTKRQLVAKIGSNKAVSSYEKYADEHPSLSIQPIPLYITASNASEIIDDNSIIFSCVDNHKTRKVLQDLQSTLSNSILITGGNEYFDGNVNMVVRQDSKYLTPTLFDLHPELKDPKDKSPDEMSCEELSQSSFTQIAIVNQVVASIMLSTFISIFNSPRVSETFFNSKTGTFRSERLKNPVKLNLSRWS